MLAPTQNPAPFIESDEITPAWDIGYLLEELRHDLGITQKEAARRAGISRSMVSEIELGRENPSLETIERLARAYNVQLTITAWPAHFGVVPPPVRPRPDGWGPEPGDEIDWDNVKAD